jgi:acyl dehydratase
MIIEEGRVLYAADLHVGQQFPFGTYRMELPEMLEFAGRYDPVPIHTDLDAAAAGPFGEIIASGFHTMAVYQRLVVEAVWRQVQGIVGRSFEIRLLRPVRAGTELTGVATITEITHRPERADAVVIIETDLTDGEHSVLALRLDVLVAAAPTT